MLKHYLTAEGWRLEVLRAVQLQMPEPHQCVQNGLLDYIHNQRLQPLQALQVSSWMTCKVHADRKRWGR
jgi:hypothetical protein